MTQRPETYPYLDGFAARQSGTAHRQEAPYRRGTLPYRMWQAGWDHADEIAVVLELIKK